jgi:proteasome accessory factor C
VLADATATRRRVAMEYYSRAQDRSSTRTVSPQRLSYHRDSWYLEAWCHLRQQLRTFAVDTVRSARLLEEAALEIDKQRLDAYFASSFGIFSGPERQTAELLFCQERARWVAEERWHPDQRGEFQEDGRYRLSLPYSNPQELLMEILKYGPDVEVLAPACLRRQVAQRLRLALGFYDDVEASASRS